VKLVESLGSNLPLTTEVFAGRAHDWSLDPNRNSLKEILDRAESVAETPPLLGVFNDIPWHKFRESEAHAWARAGFQWVVNDAEHSQWEGHYGREHNAALARLGLMPIQRLHREALSSHGDAFQLGARATMRPYATTFEHAVRYFQSINFPVPGEATDDDRGGYPVRAGDRRLLFTPETLRAAETETQGWIQFETPEYILDTSLRDQVLDLMVEQGPNKACGFVGPFDAIMRAGEIPEMEDAVNALFRAAAERKLHTGRVIGFGDPNNSRKVEDAIVVAIENGARLIAIQPLTSDMTFYGAAALAEPFIRAADRCGF